MYIVESGRVRVSVCHADGQEKTLYVADTGAMIGESDCILGQPYSSTATVVLPSRVPVSYTHLDVYKRQSHTRRRPAG